MTTESEQEGESSLSPEVSKLHKQLARILAYDIDNDLVRIGPLGLEGSFTAGRSLFEEVRHYVERLNGLPWSDLTDRQVTPVAAAAEQTSDMLANVAEFTLNRNDPFAARDHLIQNLQTQFDTLREDATPLIGALSWGAVDIGSIRAEAQEVVREARDAGQQLLEEIGALKSDAERDLEAIRGVSREAGVAHHSEVFKLAADRHDERATVWLRAAIGAAIFTVLSAILIVWLWDTNGDISDASVLQIVLVKGLIVLAGFYLLVNSARIYRTHSHLAISNRHREDALRTFRAFVEGTETSETKDRVLLEATRTIFGPSNTGLVDTHESLDMSELLKLLGRSN